MPAIPHDATLMICRSVLVAVALLSAELSAYAAPTVCDAAAASVAVALCQQADLVRVDRGLQALDENLRAECSERGGAPQAPPEHSDWQRDLLAGFDVQRGAPVNDYLRAAYSQRADELDEYEEWCVRTSAVTRGSICAR